MEDFDYEAENEALLKVVEKIETNLQSFCGVSKGKKRWDIFYVSIPKRENCSIAIEVHHSSCFGWTTFVVYLHLHDCSSNTHENCFTSDKNTENRPVMHQFGPAWNKVIENKEWDRVEDFLLRHGCEMRSLNIKG